MEYALPFGALGRLVHRLQVSRDLAEIFGYRARRMEELVGCAGAAPGPATPSS